MTQPHRQFHLPPTLERKRNPILTLVLRLVVASVIGVIIFVLVYLGIFG